MTDSGLRRRLRHDLRDAMKARDRTRVSVLRATLGAIDNAEAVASDDRPNLPGGNAATEVDRRELTEPDVAGVVAHEAAELRADAALHRARGDASPLADLEARLAILETYLG
jgi:uncharacterized protein YqeY